MLLKISTCPCHPLINMKEFIKKTRFLATTGTELVTLKCLWLYYEVIVVDYRIGYYEITRHQGFPING